MVYVTHVGSWVQWPDSDLHIFDWWDEYRTQHYKIAGIVDVLWPDETEYHWDDVEKYKPKSPVPVMVYRRIGP